MGAMGVESIWSIFNRLVIIDVMWFLGVKKRIWEIRGVGLGTPVLDWVINMGRFCL
jgi:hypothetical protein